MTKKVAFDAARIRLIQAIMPVVHGTEWWPRRHEVERYVNLCEMSGFCDTDDARRLCAQRYMAGKRKVSPPGSGRRKKAEKLRRKILASPPSDLIEAIRSACNSKAADEYRRGKEKAMNAMVGMVIAAFKTDPSVVRALLDDAIRNRI